MIRAFLALLETRGAGEAPAADLRRELSADGDEGWAALVDAGVIRAADLATTHPCDGPDCARDVRERTKGPDGARRFLALCARSPRECETLHLAEADLACERVDLGAFLDVVTRVLRIDPRLDDPAIARAGALVGPDEPILLGEQLHDDGARDVYFARRPRAPAFRALLAERRTAPRGALVLIPTTRGIDPELLARHAAGRVEIGALSDRLTVQHGSVVPAVHLRVVALAGAEPANGAPTAAPIAARPSVVVERMPRPKGWSDVTFYLVDNEGSIGVAIGRRHRRFTAAELGMTNGRTHEPVRAFVLLRRICDGNGQFDTRPWGGRENGKKIVSELRHALSSTFAIDASPIEPYSRGTKSWKTRFRAFMRKPGEMAEW